MHSLVQGSDEEACRSAAAHTISSNKVGYRRPSHHQKRAAAGCTQDCTVSICQAPGSGSAQATENHLGRSKWLSTVEIASIVSHKRNAPVLPRTGPSLAASTRAYASNVCLRRHHDAPRTPSRDPCKLAGRRWFVSINSLTSCTFFLLLYLACKRVKRAAILQERGGPTSLWYVSFR